MRADVLLALAAISAVGCGREPRHPPTDAAQAAFRDGTLSRLESRGRRLFRDRCATCHGTTGRGDGQNAFNLDPPPPDFSESSSKLDASVARRIIEEGSAAVGRSALCPPRTGSLVDGDADALSAYLRVLARPARKASRARNR